MLKSAFKIKAFIPFIMAGVPDLATTQQMIKDLVEMGADVIELGVPFSDPIADGVVNQKAAEIALTQGVNLTQILNFVRSLRDEGLTVPIVLFSYFNPILALGLERFAQQAKFAGVDGVLVVDLPPEEQEAFYHDLSKHQVEYVLLASPTTQLNRLNFVKSLEPAFIYFVSRCAVTGTQSHLPILLKEQVIQLKEFFSEIPVAVGFGVTTPHQAAEIAAYADGVIVGSALMHFLNQSATEEFKQLAMSFTAAIHGSQK